MKEIHKIKLAILLIISFFSTVFCESGTAITLLNDKNAKNYIVPIGTMLSSSMNSGYFRKATSHKVLGFDLTVNLAYAILPSKGTIYNYSVPDDTIDYYFPFKFPKSYIIENLGGETWIKNRLLENIPDANTQDDPQYNNDSLFLEFDIPFTEDLCGSCTACLDACPTNAFPEPYVLDASKCISYLTIEHRDNLPVEMESKLSGWIYGCDICQEVCPWNIKFSQESTEVSFQPRSNLQKRSVAEWNQLTQEDFRSLFKNSAVKRTKFKGLKRNIDVVNKSIDESSDSY